MENQLSMQDQLLAVIKEIIEDNIGNESFSVADLAKEVGLSRSMLHRKLIRLTGKSATDLITEIRLTRALELLENDVATVSEIAYRLGYSSPSYFNKVFKKTFNVSPSDVRKKGSGRLSHLSVVKEPGILSSARSKRSRSYVIAGVNILMIIIVGVGAASLILGLVDNVSPLSRLPEWTTILIIVLLSAVFIISVFLSWTYDLYPEKVIVKTKPANKVKTREEHPLSNRWKIASYISFIAIVALVVLNTLAREETFDKSIAVLPFHNDSPDHDNEHILNGYRTSVLDNLSKIKDLVVVYSSADQYRNTDKSVSEIAEEMNVGYLLYARGQIYGNNIRLTVQLMNADGKILWSKPYNRKITKVEDVISLQSEIAHLAAKEIDAIITPQERQLIEKVPTTSLIAYDYFQRGREQYIHYALDHDIRFSFDYDDRAVLERAEKLYYEALKYDQTYALAYVGLGNIYQKKNYSDEFLSDHFLDSSLVLANKALFYDDQLTEAYVLRGNYYRYVGQLEEALEDFDKAISLNPNHWEAYYGKAELFVYDDVIKVLYNAHKSASFNQGPFLPNLFIVVSGCYRSAGFKQKSLYYLDEAIKLNNDSVFYYNQLAHFEVEDGDYNKALDYSIKAFNIDSNNVNVLQSLGRIYERNKQFEESLKYYKKWIERLNFLGEIDDNDMHRIGYAYWVNGYEEEAKFYFNKQLEYCNRLIELGTPYAKELYYNYDLAAVFAFRGDKERAYENLKIFNQRETMPLWLNVLINYDPLFDKIRDEPEFQQILRDVEAKYQAEHERVREWLEENDMLY